MNDNNSKATQIPVWDGMDESWPLWNIKFQSLAVYHDCEDVLDCDVMKDCPTKMELKGLDPNIAKDKAFASLYKANSRLAAIFKISQQTTHGLGFLEQTKSDEFPSGIVYRDLELMKDRYATQIRPPTSLLAYNSVLSICWCQDSQYQCQLQQVLIRSH